jgi:hypothetical protein
MPLVSLASFSLVIRNKRQSKFYKSSAVEMTGGHTKSND